MNQKRALRVQLCPNASDWLQAEKQRTGQTATYILNQLIVAQTNTDDAQLDARGTHESNHDKHV